MDAKLAETKRDAKLDSKHDVKFDAKFGAGRDAKKEAEVDAKVDVKIDTKVDENKGVKVESNMDIKGGTTRVDVQTRFKIRCKTRLKTCRKT